MAVAAMGAAETEAGAIDASSARLWRRLYRPRHELAARSHHHCAWQGRRGSCIRGLRMRVQDVLEMLAAGTTSAEIIEEYPYLEADDVRAALAYAAA